MVDDLRERLVERLHCGGAHELGELALEGLQRREALHDPRASALAEANQLCACVCWIRHALEVPQVDELVDELADRLLRHSEARREIGEARALQIDMGEERRVRRADGLLGPFPRAALPSSVSSKACLGTSYGPCTSTARPR